jgi:predicted AlkP superfamily phosphohydrolase/phosphomutase
MSTIIRRKILIILLIAASPGLAYVGPGAGFALLSSLFTLLISFLLAFFSMLTLPFRLFFLWIKRRKILENAKIRKVIVLGFDGLDPDLCDRFMARGLLPNFTRLKKEGVYRRLQTTFPALSPVAWSSFATGVNPGKHRIFDFLHRNPKSYLPELSSSRVEPTKRSITAGKYRIPVGKPTVAFLRKSRSFWKILGEHGIFSHIIRVPITFPPEKFNGACLSAMCTPDLRGTQGTFSFYTAGPRKPGQLTGGVQQPLIRKNEHYHGELTGPDNSLLKDPVPMKISFILSGLTGTGLTLSLDRKKIRLRVKQFSPWIPIRFRAGLGVTVHGICQFYLKSISPEIQLYVSPIQIDPEKPALPVSHPLYYSVYLSKLFGRYGTLGLIEDTWALNEKILDETAFMDQVNLIHHEREQQFFHALEKTKDGVVACVFDATDRVQHMFFRYQSENHPSHTSGLSEDYRDSLEKLYVQADKLLGRVIGQTGDALLFVMSDHGFKLFQRGVNLNTWLREQGYLDLKPESRQRTYLQHFDWSKTRAYAIGLAGLYLNRQGRENQGIVPDTAVQALKAELIGRLSGLKDPETGEVAIETVYDTTQIFKGPYADEGPDLIVGFRPGYRISWEAAVGETSDSVFSDNQKYWSGDHSIDPKQVPGVLFCNRPVQDQTPALIDLAPTILSLFGIPVPGYMDGRVLRISGLQKDEGK